MSKTLPISNLKVRDQIFNKYKQHCAYCGCELKSIKDMQIDHITSKMHHDYYGLKEHPDRLENLNPSCRSCNKFKGVSSLETFRENIEKQPEQLRKDKPTFRLAERFGLIITKPQRVIFYFEML